MTGTIRRVDNRWTVNRDKLGRPAIGWLRYIDNRGYRDLDYLVGATARADRGFFWDDIPRKVMTSQQSRILEEATDFGIGTGFVMPLRKRDGSIRALSAWAERLDHDDNATRISASLVATSLIQRLEDFEIATDSPAEPIDLSRAHRFILQSLLQKRSASAMAERSRYSEREIEILIADATSVMGSTCPIHATSRAVALGLL